MRRPVSGDKPWGTLTISGAGRRKGLLEEDRSFIQVPKETQESSLSWTLRYQESRRRKFSERRPGMSSGLGREEIFRDIGGNRFGRAVGAWQG